MSLVEVADSMDYIENARAVAQEFDGVAGALDFPKLRLRDAGSAKEVALNGPSAQQLGVAVYGGFDGRLDRNDPALSEPGDEISAFSKPGISQASPSSQNRPSFVIGRWRSR